MDEEKALVTEVQIKKNRSYLPYLRKTVSCIAAGLGMGRKDMEDAVQAVSEVCLNSIESASNSQDEGLSIKLSTHGIYMTVEITDGAISSDPESLGEWLGRVDRIFSLDRIRNLADSVELFSGNEGTTIHITKLAHRPETASSTPVGHLAALAPSALQAR